MGKKDVCEEIYLMSPLAQKEATGKYCFDKCKKVVVGGIDFANAPWLCCYEKDCSYTEKTADMGKGEINGKTLHIIVRKLKEVEG